jgi:hypothetical protein
VSPAWREILGHEPDTVVGQSFLNFIWPEDIERTQAALDAAALEAVEQNPDKAPSAPFDRLAQRADNMAKRSAALKRIADTGKPLYDNLSNAQKARFKKLARLLLPHHHRMHAWNRDDGTSNGGPAGLTTTNLTMSHCR